MSFSPTSRPTPLYRSSPPHSTNFPVQIPQIPVKPSVSSNGSLRFRGKSNRIPLHGGFLAKSTGTEPSTDQEDVSAASGGGNRSGSGSLLSLLCPLLRLFGSGDPSQPRNDALEVATTSLSSLARFPWGSVTQAQEDRKDPPLRLQLFEFEACPFCRRVREAMTELDLSYEVYPCPKGSQRHREMVRNIGGKEQFPLLVDPNTGVAMYESGDIVKYLFQEYGNGRQPSFGLLESTLFTGWMPTLLRAGRGMTLWDRAGKDPPSEKLELFSYENNAYARVVREALCELELPYIIHNVGKGSPSYEVLIQSSGSNEVPYLIDPNTGVKMGDYKKILTYLFQTYSSGN